MDEDIVIPIAGMVFVLTLVLGLPLVFAYIKRMSRSDREPIVSSSPDTDRRLERIEHAIDAMAVEVERISEGQRFVTQLLSDRSRERAALPAPPHWTMTMAAVGNGAASGAPKNEKLGEKSALPSATFQSTSADRLQSGWI